MFQRGGYPSGIRCFLTSFERGAWGAVHNRRPGFAGSGPRGSALGPGHLGGESSPDSDGKPCSGVRGGQRAPTEVSGGRRDFVRGLALQGENAVCTAVFSLPLFSLKGKRGEKNAAAHRRGGVFLKIQSEKESFFMKSSSTKKLALAGVLCAVAVVGSVFVT